jgi:hypothetical protein
MLKVLFMPVSIAAGLVAGMIGSKIFDAVWGLIDDEEAPEPKHRDVPVGKLVVALLVQGAIFRVVRGMTDQGLRRAFAKSTGAWPGEKQPDKE